MLLEERERLVDVADLDRDVVDADEPRHALSVTVSFEPVFPESYAGSAQTPASSTIGRRRRGHVLHARPLANRVVLLSTGEEVRGRQTLRREHGAVRPAAGDRELRLDACAPDRLERRFDDARILLDVRAHVAIGIAHLDVDVRARLLLREPVRELAQELDVLLEQRVVVVARDEVDVASSALPEIRCGWTYPSTVLGRLRRQTTLRKRGDELCRELDGVHELALGASPGAPRRPRMVTRIHFAENVSTSSSPSPEPSSVYATSAPNAVEVEALGPPPDLLVDGEGDADRSALPLGMPHEVRDGGHDLCDSRPCRRRRGASSRRS